MWQVEAPFTDGYGFDFIPGDVIGEGAWLKRSVRSNHLRYVQESNTAATVHAHSVRMVNVPVQRVNMQECNDSDDEDAPITELNKMVYILKDSTHENIVDAVVLNRRL